MLLRSGVERAKKKTGERGKLAGFAFGLDARLSLTDK
jgi:hypothetical protein